MATVIEVYHVINEFAPFEIQMEFDNAGFLVGRGGAEVDRILVSLDITEQVIEEATSIGAQLIVAHHPVLFHPARSVTDGDVTGRKLLALAESGIAAICVHTNLDAVWMGVNDCLAQALRLSEVGQLHPDGEDREGRPYGIGRVGTAHNPGLSAGEYAKFVQSALYAHSVRFVDCGKPVHRVAVGGGACGNLLQDVIRTGCDTFVTSDLRYHEFLDASDLGVNIMDAGHFATEHVVCTPLAQRLSASLPSVNITVSQSHCEVYHGLGQETR